STARKCRPRRLSVSSCSTPVVGTTLSTGAATKRSCALWNSRKTHRTLSARRRQQPRRLVVTLAVAVEEQPHQADPYAKRKQRAKDEGAEDLRRHRPARLAQSEIGKRHGSREQECEHGQRDNGACAHDRLLCSAASRALFGLVHALRPLLVGGLFLALLVANDALALGVPRPGLPVVAASWPGPELIFPAHFRPLSLMGK